MNNSTPHLDTSSGPIKSFCMTVGFHTLDIVAILNYLIFLLTQTIHEMISPPDKSIVNSSSFNDKTSWRNYTNSIGQFTYSRRKISLNSDLCFHCNDSGKLICCEYCSNAFHLYCWYVNL